ncbi:uncharacterized protein GGS25DRAFT_331083 [Hypoxylon fragiforme]|uniref:uncharacterized protein n=1 Tax=Hypoxylon fragiforme TaxID=63214 RepID=UPI0020C5E511|nr:uncharacterized protein GGS25DRAFT_331083 [Hypoxylon fragiforme]KAI2607383.1 hypothetical protein GGS25DRAFT_331083 [Hypoxylon fragiforme]
MDVQNDSDYQPDSSSKSDSEPTSPVVQDPPPPTTTSRKRRRRRTTDPSSIIIPPPKRQKGVFNPRYLSLLNEEITSVASSGLSDEHSLRPLPPGQIGAVFWSPAEKHAFFTAMSRLGRDDVSGIAARITTKSDLEVRQYVALLDAADRARCADEEKRRRMVRPVDIPAAAELSMELCLAFEEAADGIAVRQETYEATLEQKRWAGRWLITPQLATVLEHQGKRRRRQLPQQHHHHHQEQDETGVEERIDNPETNDPLPFAELFILSNWLKLSNRIFMNSSVLADGNWRSISEEPPSIRATALSDFHALALSVTRRLVSATLYMAGSRIRMKQSGDRKTRTTKGLVKIKDVLAAAASVGMKENSHEFWARAARRLRLDVYDDGKEWEGRGGSAMTDDDIDLSDEEEEEEEEEEQENEINDVVLKDDGMEAEEQNIHLSTEHDPQDEGEGIGIADDTSEYGILSYAEVEAALDFPNPNPPESPHSPSPSYTSLPSDYSEPEASDNTGSDSNPSPQSPRDPTPPIIDPTSLATDLTEALLYSSLPHTSLSTHRARQALRARIIAAQHLEADAAAHDAQLSAEEEARLWGLLRGTNNRSEDPTTLSGNSSSVQVVVPWAQHRQEQDGDEEEEKEKEKEQVVDRKPGLLDRWHSEWRDHTVFYSEWEVGGGGA